jgi:hypothetical protein
MRHQKKLKQQPLVKLNLGLDESTEFQKVTHDLKKFPWPWKDNSVDEVRSFFLLAKFPAKLRGQFMDELWRILKPVAKAMIVVPYWSSMRGIADFEYEWPPWCEGSFLFFNKAWREANKSHTDLKCHFEINGGCTLAPEVQTRTAEVQAEWVKYRTNAAQDLQMTLTKA